MGTHTFTVGAVDFAMMEVRDAMTKPFEDDEDAGGGYATVVSRTPTAGLPSLPTSSIFKVLLRVYHKSIDTATHLSRAQSQSHAATASSTSAINFLRPLSINTSTHHNRTNTSYDNSTLPHRSASIMDRGRPVRKSSGACWPSVGRELGTKPAEERKRKECRFSVANSPFR